MLNSYLDGELTGAGTIIWEARRRFATGEIDGRKFTELLMGFAPSAGHCNVMGTALSMNCLAEAMGMALPGSACIPAPYRERGQMPHATGVRIVGMVREDLRPSRIITRTALVNTIRVNTTIAGQADRTHGQTQRNRRRRPVPLQRRGELHHRQRLPRRRRHTHPAFKSVTKAVFIRFSFGRNSRISTPQSSCRAVFAQFVGGGR